MITNMRAAANVRLASSSAAAPTRLVALKSLPCRRNVAARFQDDKKSGIPTISEQDKQRVERTEEGNISPSNAERRANLGTEWKSPAELQAFDGPAPETINGRGAMFGVVLGLILEKVQGLGLREQCVDHPLTLIGSFVLIALASYIPITRGYTRKEPFENGIWTAQAENWNGRVAMLGFTAMILTEAIAGMNTLEFWGSKLGF